jgi:hypothetical protein
MAYQPAARKYARDLRQQGWSLRQIATELGAALSTVSLWVQDVVLPAIDPVPTALGPVASHPVAPPNPAEAEHGTRCCRRCLRELPLDSFNRSRRGRQAWCRDCFRKYFQARGDVHRAQVRAAREGRRLAARAFIDEHLRSRCCADCGERDQRVLEFDHLAEKRANVTDLAREGASKRRLTAEVEKCDVVCVNCHRVRTAERAGSWRLGPERLESASLTPGTRRNLAYIRQLLLQSSCMDCGDRRMVVLDFDHVGLKLNNVTELAHGGWSLRRLKEEITQCEIRCSNCHRLRTLYVRKSATDSNAA